MKSFDKNTTDCAIEIYFTENNSLSIDLITDTIPAVALVQIGRGLSDRVSPDLVSGIINNFHFIEADNPAAVILPDVIPTEMMHCLLQMLLNLNKVAIHYRKEGETGMDFGIYRPGKDVSVSDILAQYNQILRRSFTTKSAVSPAKMDGFRPFSSDMEDKKDSVPDGFHTFPEPPPAKYPSDGFHEIEEINPDDVQVEHRTMWEEDPDRMQRLSYIPIGRESSFRTFPKELGGGEIPCE